MDILSIKNLTQTMSMGDATVKTSEEIQSEASNSFFSLFSSFSMSSVSATTSVAQEDNLQNTSITVDGKGYEKLNFKTSEKTDTSVKSEVDSETKETVEAYKEEVVSKISEATGIDEETVEQVMEELALTVMDLLNPQDLAQLVETLTGKDAASLLLSDDFANLMDEITVLTDNLAVELNLEVTDLQALLADFDFEVSEDVHFDDVLANVENDVLSGMTTTQDGTAQLTTVVNDKEVEMTTSASVMTEVEKEAVIDEKSEDNETSDFGVASKEPEFEAEVQDVREEKGFSRDTKDSNDSSEHLFADSHAQSHVDLQSAEAPAAETTSFANSYTSIDALELLEQVTSNLKITLANDATTMEMQLNPENLGKVFLQLSSKEGVVSAHFSAQNEVVKEVLESQMADLRTTLNQQGVKVDAIEVTVSSHGFERNLDENQHREEKEGEMMEENKKVRRSLRMDSLDELQGLMTEEEMLVAQMMRDNGNSMDLTA